ncbi:MAG: alpha/beta hydrolase [Clostridia bacterium]|nr:alpha/beta hydrolase [Clostridia bacterium]
MKRDIIDLYAYYGLTRPEGGQGYLTCYTLDDYSFCAGRTRPAMLVVAGGGYSNVSGREKEPIAMSYMSKGFNTFILEYSVKPLSYPTQLIEGCMAVAYIRENAESLHVIEDKICAIGFSAGGHLCGMLATLYADQDVKNALGEHANNCKLDGVIFAYPVLSAYGKIHQGSIVNITGGNEELRKKMDIPKMVDENSVPAFIWTTVNDNCVPSESSLLMAMAYKEKGVPFELHMFENGVHGLSLSNEETAPPTSQHAHVNVPVQQWLDLSIVWLNYKGFVIKNK